MDLDEEAAEARRMMGSFNVRVDKNVVVARQMLVTYYVPALQQLLDRLATLQQDMLSRWEKHSRDAIDALVAISLADVPEWDKTILKLNYRDGIVKWEWALGKAFTRDVDELWKEYRATLREAETLEEGVLWHVPALDVFKSMKYKSLSWRYAEEQRARLRKFTRSHLLK